MLSRSLARHSGAAEGSVAPLPFWCRFGKGGKLRLIVERAREDIQQGLEMRVIAAFHCSAQGFLNSMIARNERGIGTPHGLRPYEGCHRLARKPRPPFSQWRSYSSGKVLTTSVARAMARFLSASISDRSVSASRARFQCAIL